MLGFRKTDLLRVYAFSSTRESFINRELKTEKAILNPRAYQSEAAPGWWVDGDLNPEPID